MVGKLKSETIASMIRIGAAETRHSSRPDDRPFAQGWFLRRCKCFSETVRSSSDLNAIMCSRRMITFTVSQINRARSETRRDGTYQVAVALRTAPAFFII